MVRSLGKSACKVGNVACTKKNEIVMLSLLISLKSIAKLSVINLFFAEGSIDIMTSFYKARMLDAPI